MTLDAFLELMQERSLVWGVTDCALTLADWVMAATGCDDPAHDLRGLYSGPLGASRFVVAAGSLEALVGRCAERAGLSSTDAPVRGDIGVVQLDVGPFGAICTGVGTWAIQSSGGLFGVRAEHIAAWSVPHG